ncbi:MAG: Uma2 family endonuclease [Bdellovibrionota bacterium]
MGAKKLLTIDDWLSLPDDVRCELIEGDFVYKVLPSFAHGEFQRRLGGDLNPFDKKSGGDPPGGWWFASEVAVIYGNRPNGFIHDIAGWRREKHTQKPQGKKVTTVPDWVCEILSGNKTNDLVTKKWVLHEHKVEYYWVVDLDSEIISVFKWAEKGYINVADAKKGDTKSLEPFLGFEFNFAFLFGED